MTTDFDRDLASSRANLDSARRELLAVISSLSDADLDPAPRGHWPVRRVLEHVIWHEQIYVRMIAHLRALPSPGDMPDNTPSSISDAVERLAASRHALLDGVAGVDEETFYKLGKMGYEEYSIFSMLENEANHEREHAKKTLGSEKTSPSRPLMQPRHLSAADRLVAPATPPSAPPHYHYPSIR